MQGAARLINAQGNNLTFLLCVPRSGSSLATVMLQNHSKVFATQEMWFLMSLYDLQNNQSRPYGGAGIVNQFFNGVLPNEVFEQACRAFSLQVYNGLLQSSDAEIVVDKSPRYYYVLEFLDKLFPQSKRIWLIRNPLSILASYKKVEAQINGFNIEADLLNSRFNIKSTDLTAGLFRYFNYFSSNHPLTYRLHYEKLVSEPQEEMKKLCEFMGIEYEEGLEKYGQHMDTSKSEMFYSMGVGDPFLATHKEPHRDSIHSWKEVLDKKEVEIYCQVLGAQIFHDLGYSDELKEAERWTGVTFASEPDLDMIAYRSTQLIEATGCKWEDEYKMKTHQLRIDEMDAFSTEHRVNSQVFQLQATLRSLEKRLENSYKEQKRTKNQLEALREKINRIKSIVPFGSRLSNWAADYLIHRGRK